MWKKKGLIFSPNNDLYWQRSHATLPTPIHVNDSVYRVFFTSRSDSNIAYVGYADIDVDSGAVVAVSPDPVLAPGKTGFFDSQGVQCCSVITIDGCLYMYYLGWTKGYPEPLFYSSIGLAISHDGGETFEKFSDAPILERSQYDPWMVSGPRVIYRNGSYKMYYISGLEYILNPKREKSESRYDIKIAYSDDGIQWKRNGDVALSLEGDDLNISVMAIIEEDGLLKAWYPVHKEQYGAYRLGYAESNDGRSWLRKDDLSGIDVSDTGWDSEALDKPSIITYNGRKLLFYNGNNFGKDGFGWAEWVDD